MLGDRELIVRLQEGDLNALGALYDRYNQVVYRTALAITGDEMAAADLLQDVFLRVHRFATRIDPERAFEPWLYRVTVNLTYTWLKRRKRWFVHSIDDVAAWLTGEKKQSPAYQFEQREEWLRVSRAVERLPLHQRTVIVLHYFNDLSLQEISEIMEIPVGTVKSRLHYGRQALKAQMEMNDDAGIGEVQYEFI